MSFSIDIIGLVLLSEILFSEQTYRVFITLAVDFGQSTHSDTYDKSGDWQ